MSERATTGLEPASGQIKEEFAERLDMLEEAGQITRLSRLLTEYVLSQIAGELGIAITEENAAPFVTHLAVALTRLHRGGPPVEHSAVVEEEVRDRVREGQLVRRLLTECERFLDRPVPAPEVAYVTVHLCSILDDA